LAVRSPASVRILLYSVNGTGLGHLTRQLAIARWLRRLCDGLDLSAQILFLSCSEADFLLSAEGFPSVKVPSRAVLRAAQLSDRSAAGLIRSVARSTISELKPHAMVVDTFPTGTFDELLPALGRKSTRKVFTYREQRVEHADRIPYDRLLAHYDLMLFPHQEGEFEVPFQLPAGLQTCWTGPIVLGEEADLLPREAARKALGLPKNKTVAYAAAGGGGDRGVTRWLDLVRGVLGEFPELHLVLGAGPLSKGNLPMAKGLTWLRDFPASKYFRGFDFAVSSTGYNSAYELARFGVPAILYPQERQADDQGRRAERLASGGAAIALGELNEGELRKAVRRMLKPKFRSRLAETAPKFVPAGGARRAAEEILRVAIPSRVPGQWHLRT
jgi:UDP-N-acetylglucosamine--N-acetylmuramyl-(pentapeptide) pyrophosphoryl-undecaprenol N-acetylglucosamine transferase